MKLSKELETYKQHKEELLAAHENKFVVIHKDQIVIQNTYHEALQIGYEQFGLKPFLVKQITKVERIETINELVAEIFPDPNTINEAKCGNCGAIMLVERGLNGPTSFAMAMAKMNRQYDHFYCPYINQSWHKQLLKLRSDHQTTPSPSIKKILEQDIKMILQEHFPQWHTDYTKKQLAADGGERKERTS
jgi:hypothetical protein